VAIASALTDHSRGTLHHDAQTRVRENGKRDRKQNYPAHTLSSLNMRYLGRIRGQLLASLRTAQETAASSKERSRLANNVELTQKAKIECEVLQSAEKMVLTAMISRIAKHELRYWMRKAMIGKTRETRLREMERDILPLLT
jgi:hypothetical protein